MTAVDCQTLVPLLMRLQIEVPDRVHGTTIYAQCDPHAQLKTYQADVVEYGIGFGMLYSAG